MKIYYMTWLRNRIGFAEEEITLPADVKIITDLLIYLEGKGDSYKRSFKERSLIYASKNNRLCEHNEEISNDDEITFFSPVVGG